MKPPDIRQVDVLVVGAGPAGIACSVRAAESGSSVLMLDRAPRAGGQIWRHLDSSRLPHAARRWLQRLATSPALFVGGATIVDVEPVRHGFHVSADAAGNPFTVRTERIVLATGARELFIPFDGWNLPGVMGIGGAQAMLKSGASFRGTRVAIAGSGPLMFPVATSLKAAGARIVLLAEQADGRSVNRFARSLLRAPRILLQAAAFRARLGRVRYSTGTWVTRASGTNALESITVTDGRCEWDVPADVLCTGYGLVPNIELARLLGCSVSAGAVSVNGFQETSVRGVFAAGEVTGIAGAVASLVEGEIAGYAAASATVPKSLHSAKRDCAHAANEMRVAFNARAELRAITTPATIVCRCEDVRYDAVCDIGSSREAKLRTRAGMGPCQGRTCMPSLEFLLGWTSDTVRPPVEAALLGSMQQESATHDASS